MALAKLLDSEHASSVMGFLGESHGELLETSSPLRTSYLFASAVASQNGFALSKVDEGLWDDALCRKAIMARPLDPRWFASVPAHIKTLDFLAYTCANRHHDVCDLIPEATLADPILIRSMVEYTPLYTPEDTQRVFWLEVRVPDWMLETDRGFALACARKGISPFGRYDQLHTTDEEIVTTLLVTTGGLGKAGSFVFSNVRRCAWYTSAWIREVCASSPDAAQSMIRAEPSLELRTTMLMALPPGELLPMMCVFNTSQYVNIFGDLWRVAARRHPVVVSLIDDLHIHFLRREDEALLTEAFRQFPAMYGHCHGHIKRLRYVARAVFERSGLLIRGSPFNCDLEMALIAVRQNGLALQWLEPPVRRDPTVMIEAVQQTPRASAFVPRRLRRAINSAAAALTALTA